ncbi:MAG: hypothetical protein QGI89_01795 [Candidatus Woesearchaeota archaeon]|jgi:hypothetical protein|nr:hypothetical protein [Candidatus Woesearchaeota archaeon]
MANVSEYVGQRMYNANSFADRVYCSVNGSAIHQSLADMLRKDPEFGPEVSALEANANQSRVLAKAVIAKNSPKLTAEMEDELLKEVKTYTPSHTEFLREREKALMYRDRLAESETLDEAIGNLNRVLTYERDGIALKLNPTSNDAQDETLEEEEQSIRGKYLIDFIAQGYKFLATFDLELAERLRSSDDIIQGRQIIANEGIAGLSHPRL